MPNNRKIVTKICQEYIDLGWLEESFIMTGWKIKSLSWTQEGEGGGGRDASLYWARELLAGMTGSLGWGANIGVRPALDQQLQELDVVQRGLMNGVVLVITLVDLITPLRY